MVALDVGTPVKATVVLEEAVILCTTVAEEDFAAGTIPDGFMTLLSPVMMAVAAATRFVGSSGWEVVLTESPS